MCLETSFQLVGTKCVVSFSFFYMGTQSMVQHACQSLPTSPYNKNTYIETCNFTENTLWRQKTSPIQEDFVRKSFLASELRFREVNALMSPMIQ